MVDVLDQLIITHSVQRMLWSNYNPYTEAPPSGVLIAGRYHSHYYSTVAVQSEAAFDLLSPENQQSPLFNYLLFHAHDVRVIPWFQYNSKHYSSDFQAFYTAYVKDPFSGIIVLKPTSEEGKRHFDIRFYSEQSDRPISTIAAQDVPQPAQKNISSLMRYWVTADRFVKRGLQVL